MSGRLYQENTWDYSHCHVYCFRNQSRLKSIRIKLGIRHYKKIYQDTVHFGRRRKQYFGYVDNDLVSLIVN